MERDYHQMLDFFEKEEQEKNEINEIYKLSARYDNSQIVNIEIDNLKPFPNHPFSLYTGEKFEDLKESIRVCGIINPLIVLELGNNEYEILSGHNRCEAVKSLGLKTVPCLILSGLSDDDALMIVLDSNIKQRSMSEMKISEQARIYALDVEVNKRQGKRSDLIKNIEKNLEILSSGADLTTSAPLVPKLTAREIIGEKYGVSRGTITRLLRINTLISEIKERVDDETIAVRAGVELSYLSAINQKFVDDIMTEYHYKLDIKKAQQLRELEQKNKFDRVTVVEVFEGKYGKSSSVVKKLKSVTLKPKFLSQYYDASSASSADITKDIETGIGLWQDIKKSFPEQTVDSIRKSVVELLKQHEWLE